MTSRCLRDGSRKRSNFSIRSQSQNTAYKTQGKGRMHGRGGNQAMRDEMLLVSVVVGLVGTLLGQTQVISLVVRQLCELDVESGQMRGGNFLVELLREHVHAEGVGRGVVPQLHLGQDLVGEGVGHDE